MVKILRKSLKLNFTPNTLGWNGLISTHVCAFRRIAQEKSGFVTATKLGTTKNFFFAATKNFAAATKLDIELNILLL